MLGVLLAARLLYTLGVSPPPMERTCLLLRCTVYVLALLFSKGSAVALDVVFGVTDVRCVGVYVGSLV